MTNIVSEICSTFKLTYEQFLSLTGKDIERMQTEKNEKERQDNIANGEKFIKMLRICCPDWQKMCDFFGEENVIRCFARTSFSRYFSSTYGMNDKIRALPKEQQALFKIDDYGSRHYYLTTSYIDNALEDLLKDWNKKLACYNLRIYCSGSEFEELGLDIKVSISVPMKITTKDKDGNETIIDTTHNFECKMSSLMSQSVDAVIEDYLTFIAFHNIVSRENDNFKKVNGFFNSQEWLDLKAAITNKYHY